MERKQTVAQMQAELHEETIHSIRSNTDAATADQVIALRQKGAKLPVQYRAVTEQDVPFIFSSWLRSYKQASAVKHIAPAIYFNEQHKLVERLFHTAKIIVAANPNDISQIYGYIFYDMYDGVFAIHYIYVKDLFRSLGVADGLLKQTGYKKSSAGLYTHETGVAIRNAPKHNLIYHPFLLMNYKLTYDSASLDYNINVKRQTKLSE